jgi:hypothetical protein
MKGFMGKIWEKQWNNSWDMASILLLEGEANATKQKSHVDTTITG